jgi:hypothetical protein
MNVNHVAVIDPANEGVGYLEFDFEDSQSKEMFNILFDFHEDSLEDHPVVNGIIEFVDKDNFTVLVSTDFETLKTECAVRLKIAV